MVWIYSALHACIKHLVLSVWLCLSLWLPVCMPVCLFICLLVQKTFNQHIHRVKHSSNVEVKIMSMCWRPQIFYPRNFSISYLTSIAYQFYLLMWSTTWLWWRPGVHRPCRVYQSIRTAIESKALCTGTPLRTHNACPSGYTWSPPYSSGWPYEKLK